MLLARLLDGVAVSKLFMLNYGAMAPTQDVEVRGLQYDSRKVRPGDLFVAIPGKSVDGHRFISEAIERGAQAVVLQDDAASPDALFLHTHVVKLVVPDARKALALMAATFYGHPSRRLRLIGVTGTNGKTTTTFLLKSALEAHGDRVGLIGTIAYHIGDERIPATHTTPESLELNDFLAAMVGRGCTAAVMEVSSHALALSRVYGLQFAAGVFTNFTQDHLDFHGTMDDYFRAKKLLFGQLNATAVAITNADDPRGDEIVAGTRARIVRYGLQGPADVVIRELHMSVRGMDFKVAAGGRETEVTTPLTGRFNASNILAAFSAATAAGVDAATAAAGISRLESVRGRFEQITSPAGWTAVIDYAHTPDALENILTAIRELLPRESPGRIITVFGCGGNRDKEKRPKMGRIVSTLSTITVVTSDNPRQEDPQAIIDQVLTGVLPGRTVYAEPDRRQAIIKGLLLAEPGDVVLIAGKGHEDYQVIGSTKTHLDDREEVEMFIRNLQ